MQKLNIAFLQILPAPYTEGKTEATAYIAEQQKRGAEACRCAKEKGAHIALFPEMWSCGYHIPRNTAGLEALSVSAQSDFIQNFKSLSRELDMAIGITLLESHEPKPLNSFILFDKNGEEKLHYAKVHTCDFADEARLESGEDFFVCDIDTACGTVKTGAMICFDREFPESARCLMLKGAELILAPNACPMELNRLCALRTRAYENKTAVATCNYPAPHPDCNGNSTLFDGVAWLCEEPSSRDVCVFQAGEQEGVYVAELDLDLLRRYREHEAMGGRYRKPGAYGILAKNASDGAKPLALTSRFDKVQFRE